LRLVESHLSLGPVDAALANGLCRVLAAEGAEVEHEMLQQRAEPAKHVASVTAEVAAGASYRLRAVHSGAKVARLNAAVLLQGEAASCELQGATLAGGTQQLGLYSLIHHIAPGCRSNQLQKHVAGGQAECIFRGRIRVDKKAQQTDSSQLCRSLLLQKQAKVKVMPSLQIQADDVSCSHGAAVTELDADELFYMASRGLSIEQARKLLLVAFPQDVVAGLRKSAPRAYERLLKKLQSLASEVAR